MATPPVPGSMRPPGSRLKSCAHWMQPGVLVDNIEVREPSLDDVFFSLTAGHLPDGDDGESRDGDVRESLPQVPAGTASLPSE